MIGEDARYTHFLGELDYSIDSRTQLDVVEAHVLAHLPWVTQFSQGGIDLKLGQWVTLLGAEVITAPDNPFFSHSYIFNFGPFKHTGLMATDHVNSRSTYSRASLRRKHEPRLAGRQQRRSGVRRRHWPQSARRQSDGSRDHAHGPENPKQLDPLGVGWPNTPLLCGCNPNTTCDT